MSKLFPVIIFFLFHCLFLLTGYSQELKMRLPLKHDSKLEHINAKMLADENRLITYGDNEPILWDVRNKIDIVKLTGHDNEVIKIIEAGKSTLSVSNDKVIIWNDDFTEKKEFKSRGNNAIIDVDFSYPYLAIASWEEVTIWDVTGGGLVKLIPLGTDSWGMIVRINPGNSSLYTVSTNYAGKSILNSGGDWDNHANDSIIKIWNFKTGQQTGLIKPDGKSVKQIILDTKRNTILTLTELGFIGLYDTRNTESPVEKKTKAIDEILEKAKYPTDKKDLSYNFYEIDSLIFDSNNNYLLVTGDRMQLISLDEDTIIENDLKFKVDEDYGEVRKLKNIIFRDGILSGSIYFKSFRYNVKSKRKQYIDCNKILSITPHYIVAEKEDKQGALFTAILNNEGDQVKQIYSQTDNILQSRFTADGKLLLVSSYGVTELNIKTLQVNKTAVSIKSLGGGYVSNRTKFINTDNNAILLKSDLHGGGMRKINLLSGKIQNLDYPVLSNTKAIALDTSGKYLFGLSGDTLKTIDLEDELKPVNKYTEPNGINHFAGKYMIRLSDPQLVLERIVSPVAFSKNGGYAAISVNDSLLHLRNNKTGALLSFLKLKREGKEEFSLMKFIFNDKKLFYLDSYSNACIIDVATFRIEKKIDIDNGWEDLIDLIELDNQQLLWITDIGFWEKYDYLSNKIIVSKDLGVSFKLGFALAAGKKQLITWIDDKNPVLWDLKQGNKIAEIPTTFSNIQNVFLDEKTERLVLVSDDFLIRIYHAKTYRLIMTFSLFDNEYIAWTGDNNYMGSRLAVSRIRFENEKGDSYTFNQFDARLNRPDKLLFAAGNNDTLLINSYRKAWEKRIKKLGIDSSRLSANLDIPSAEFSNRDSISFEHKASEIELSIKANGFKTQLDHFNIWINEVPLFGQRGISIRKRNTTSFDTTINIKLSPGENRIETSTSNVSGTESYRIPLYVNYTPAVKEKETTRFIGIGIDQFADNQYNLQYSSKDIRDLAKKLKEKFKDDIIIDTLFNENVSTSNVKALKQTLLQTRENDKVIIAYSGHGMLNKEYDYYLSTYAVNFEKPEQNGLPYDELENLLDSIPARKKLLLIDACHSGEVDKVELIRLKASSDSLIKGVEPVAYKQEGRIGLKNSFELMQSLFVNVGKSTGATIISAAAGTQFALERNDLKNGVFTYSILEAMNKYPTLKISELKKIVGERVEQLTNGLQKPTSRNETIAADWSF